MCGVSDDEGKRKGDESGKEHSRMALLMSDLIREQLIYEPSPLMVTGTGTPTFLGDDSYYQPRNLFTIFVF